MPTSSSPGRQQSCSDGDDRRRIQAPLAGTRPLPGSGYDIGPAVPGQGWRYAERLPFHCGVTRRPRSTAPFLTTHSGHTAGRKPAASRRPPSRQAVRAAVERAGQPACSSPLCAGLGLPPVAQQTQPPALYHATEHLPICARPRCLLVHDLIFERYPEHHTRRK